MNIEQLEQLEYLLKQSSFGNHLLFEMDQIKSAFLREGRTDLEFREIMTSKKIDEIKQLLEELIKKPTLAEKKEYIEKLSENSRKLIIRAYFNILDNTLFQNKTTIH